MADLKLSKLSENRKVNRGFQAKFESLGARHSRLGWFFLLNLRYLEVL